MAGRPRAYALTQQAIDYLDATAWQPAPAQPGPVVMPSPHGRRQCPCCYLSITVEDDGSLRAHGTSIACLGSGSVTT